MCSPRRKAGELKCIDLVTDIWTTLIMLYKAFFLLLNWVLD